MKECWFCNSSIDVEKDKWQTVDIDDPNSIGSDIDIHEDCLGAFHYTIGMMKNRKQEIAKCWICHSSIQMCGNGWECIDLCVPELNHASVDMHSDCLAALKKTMEVMRNTRVNKQSQDTRDNLQ